MSSETFWLLPASLSSEVVPDLSLENGNSLHRLAEFTSTALLQFRFSFALVSLDLKIGAVRVLLDRIEVGPHILLTSLMKRTVCCRDKILYRAMAFLNVSVK